MYSLFLRAHCFRAAGAGKGNGDHDTASSRPQQIRFSFFCRGPRDQLMSFKIYTKTGDDGTTGLFGGGRVAKDSLRIESYGAVDELNSAIGLARAHPLAKEHDDLLGIVQEQLFIVGADLATPRANEAKNVRAMRVTSEEIVCLERAIDDLEVGLPPLKNFILPGGSPSGASLHLARTVCRRAERRVAALMHQEAQAASPV